MDTLLITHPACLDHDTGPGHPECADRLRFVLRTLDKERFALLARQEAPPATREQLARAHPDGYLDHVADAIPAHGYAGLDGDTVVSPGSGEAALRAAGAVCAAVDELIAGRARNAFCAVRPPGHHAETHRAMGFCLYGNAAIGALHAQAAHGLTRVAVMDFDVHHGNGTQDIFWNRDGLFYASTHQMPLFPGTGRAEETGAHANILNAPLPPGAGSPEFRHAMADKVLPALDAFRPELLIVSAGFDAHSLDPLAGLDLTEQDFAWATAKLGELAARHCGGRMVSVLEGGYNLQALAASVEAHVKELMAC